MVHHLVGADIYILNFFQKNLLGWNGNVPKFLIDRSFWGLMLVSCTSIGTPHLRFKKTEPKKRKIDDINIKKEVGVGEAKELHLKVLEKESAKLDLEMEKLKLESEVLKMKKDKHLGYSIEDL
uniref:Uncharacterized protein n=1 Tax=Globodera rostochiensis TaxID=31243 RepID=A0A914I4X3_GLORO